MSLLFPFRSRSQRRGPIAIRRATEEDLPAIRELLHDSPHSYTGLGGAIREALRDDIALTAWQQDALAGFVMTHRQGPQNSWIHAFGVAQDVPLDRAGQRLIGELETTAQEAGIQWIGYMDEYNLDWLCRLLRRAGFDSGIRVASYEAAIGPSPEDGPPIPIRPAQSIDLPTIARVDQLAFGPLWAYQERIFHTMLGQTPCFLVAERERTILGYILATLHQGDRAHIVRIAVHPSWQGQGIGRRILSAAFDLLRDRGVRWVSLNTQERNVRSRRLYRRFGFHPTGDSVMVWVKQIG